MTLKQARKFRKERVRELLLLATVLEEAELVGDGRPLVRDTGPLRSAAGQCGDQSELIWGGYEFAGLEFSLASDELRHTRPNGAEPDLVELAVSLGGPCLNNGVEDDPFTKLNVNIVVNGLDANANPLMAAWHLDKHEGGESEFEHPNYHFHYGGKKSLGI